MEKIIERVQKLLKLAGNNTNENEALAALEKAQAILAEHNLTMAEIGELPEAESEDQKRQRFDTETNMPERYNRWIWNAVGKANGCYVVSCRPNPKAYRTIYTMVGRRVNTIVATQMALYLCQTMKRLCNEAAKAEGRKDFPWKNAYLVGMASRLCQRIAEMRIKQEQQTTGNALVLWSAEEDKLNRAFAETVFSKLSTVKKTSVRYNGAALAKGGQDANKVSLVQQVGASARTAPKLS